MLQGEDDGSTVVSMGAYVEARDAEKPLGVYAVYDAEKKVQYVGYSRNVVVALKTHSKRLGAEKCAYTRVMVFANKVSTSSRSLSLQGSLHGKRGVNQFECGLREPGEPPPAIFVLKRACTGPPRRWRPARTWRRRCSIGCVSWGRPPLGTAPASGTCGTSSAAACPRMRCPPRSWRSTRRRSSRCARRWGRTCLTTSMVKRWTPSRGASTSCR
eukprot:656603-Prorocentrum_minimum.AAC.2